MKGFTRVAALALVVALAGCGIADPNVPREPVAPPAPASARTPGGVVRAQRDALVRIAVDYTLTQATWSPDTYVTQGAHLAVLATGPALAQLASRDGQPPAAIAARLAAASASSSASLLGTDRPAGGRQVVVAYKTTATGPGRDPRRASYAIAHVTLARHDGRWRVTGFSIAP